MLTAYWRNIYSTRCSDILSCYRKLVQNVDKLVIRNRLTIATHIYTQHDKVSVSKSRSRGRLETYFGTCRSRLGIEKIREGIGLGLGLVSNRRQRLVLQAHFQRQKFTEVTGSGKLSIHCMHACTSHHRLVRFIKYLPYFLLTSWYCRSCNDVSRPMAETTDYFSYPNVIKFGQRYGNYKVDTTLKIATATCNKVRQHHRQLVLCQQPADMTANDSNI